ncbi:NmrA family NAD(P)-binding protein [Streptomyces sp. AN091965]|uniref:NmrA family NAD(P)-binding protein n=1 Tax=Streptomyces sp. AN091965 TaxID=2927803 RepID=UPI001F602DCD|nr:NAD(P)H-binding protein [Streptomyces sp. AN091965]MCI3932403.1 NAD(P)H-binding protein [Streptomyces sp. AN091965]
MTTTPQTAPQTTPRTDDLILVLGATGKTGRRLVPRLRAAGHTVRAASRSGETRFDWNERSTWSAALDGVSALYLVAPEEPEPVTDFVAQAVAAGVRRFVVLSGRGVEVSGESFLAGMARADRVVRETDVDWTVIRANNFAQNFDEDFAHAPLLAGRLALPVGDVVEPFVDVEDIAEVAAALLTEEGHTHRVYDLSGPRALSYADAVAEIAAASGRPMRFEAVTEEQFLTELRATEVPEPLARELAAVFTFTAEGHLSPLATGVQDVLGRAPRDFSAYVKSAAARGAWA